MNYIGEIRMFAGTFPPNGWAFCDGQLMPISENDALFILLGTTYGGDGQETFALPDLRCRLPLHMGTNPGTGTNYQIGEKAGVESVSLTTQQIPVHNHGFLGTTSVSNESNPENKVVAEPSAFFPYVNLAPTAAMGSNSITPTGGSQPHTNMMPSLCINFIISLFGVFPNQN